MTFRLLPVEPSPPCSNHPQPGAELLLRACRGYSQRVVDLAELTAQKWA